VDAVDQVVADVGDAGQAGEQAMGRIDGQAGVVQAVRDISV
jgi:hypothetical protein